MRQAIRFDDAWQAALRVAQAQAGAGFDAVLLRDLLGRATLLIDDRSASFNGSSVDWESLREAFSKATGPFAGLDPVQAASGLFAPDSVMNSADLAVIRKREPGQGQLAVLDRAVVGIDWLRPAVEESSDIEHRVTLYGFKGGVGRSTAAAVLARYLAETGRCVLVVDLDLESPGVSALLEDPAQLPNHGVVDHLVEAGVGNESGLDLVCRSSVLPVRGNGEVWLAPAGGRPRPEYEYLSKLNRIYTDLPPAFPDGEGRPFARRLEAAVSACEAQVAERSRRPDVVLLDSRAGMHDVAAAAITQLAGLALLFVADNPHTWAGYDMLFEQWERIPARAQILRERLKMVAAMLPQADADERLSRLRDRAQELFARIYDDEQGADPAAFNPAPDDEDAPHSPIPILFSADLIGLDAGRTRDWLDLPLIQAAYSMFLSQVERLVPPFREDAS
ncbi:KGGVGR-motif variant AAA ATPase [Kitasatospora griseola]|uniref:KGGVGR-motif variant AAA ATPase n=1 Tax=Kitasatospora griseola TaxID=2064 RepID=UPI0034484EA9